ncbi:MAG: hypothetical protein MUP63_00710 [Candidatus Nanohaloarchaeota archaeon QJJ-7]|nr:hypothetical protein [Candidatus Nanohaloarchaeota archaeon QJJ-7]
MFFTVFGGKWANIGGLVGEAGYNAISEPISAVSGVVGGVPQSVKNQFDPCHNKRMAEIQCAADLYLGGNVYSAATGSASVSQCVKDKIAECDAAAKSEKVTDPVVVELGNTIIEPFNIDTDDSHLRVFIPLTNTMVNDLQGRPLDVPAEDVNVSVGFQYLDKEVASAWDNVSYIPNSETRYVEFEENDEGNFLFPAVNAESTMTDQEIREKLQEVKKNCAGDELDSDFDIEPEDGDDVDNGSEAAYSSECVNAVGTIEKDLESEGGNLQPERLAMIAETLDTPVADAMPDSLAVHFSDSLGDNRVRVKRNHDVNVDVSYNYSVEAAFTDSSRWSSGNNLLKVWTEPSWGELDPGERESWRKENCGTVKKQGIDFQKQRTSALTTPVVPVMYADCGGSLFTGFDELARQGDQYRKDITISAGANLNPDLSDRAESFRIFEAQTDCTGEGTKHLTDLEGTYDVEGGEAQIQPEDFEREVTVEGDKKTIGCSMNMSIRVNLENTVKYAEGSNED